MLSVDVLMKPMKVFLKKYNFWFKRPKGLHLLAVSVDKSSDVSYNSKKPRVLTNEAMFF